MVAIDVEKEKKEIINHYRKLLRKAKPVLKDSDAKLIKKAFTIAAEAHKDMRRKSGEPYILHPLAVAEICVEEIGLGTTSILAALMHDVVEDSDMELADIEKIFGKKVARIIDGLTKIAGVFEYGTSQQAENFRKMLFTLSEDVRVILIKLADRLHNMRTLESMPRNKQLKISSETIYLYAPLAHRLGLNAIKTELEDLYLRFTDRPIYNSIASKIDDTRATRNKFIKGFMQPIVEELNKQNIRCEVKGRPKSIYSIWNKMKRQNIPFEEVYDLFAIRVIIDAPQEQEKALCWQVYSIVTDFYTPNPDRLRDWISTPKSNGYESLHTTVMAKNGQWVEVQIRTERMDDIAEKGYAAHWKYKESSGINESNLEKWLARVRDTLEHNDHTALDFVDDFRGNLFTEEVFAFTPKGELKTLPSGATALDFAYEIHSQIGSKCIGAKINNRLVPISHVLKNGDQVEILTSSKQKPNEDWLRFVVSSKAKGHIKDSLKEEKKQSAHEGKEIIMRKLKQLKVEASQDTLEHMREYFNAKTHFDLYYRVGRNIIGTADIKRFTEFKPTSPFRAKPPAQLTDAKLIEKEITALKNRYEDMLLIGEDMDVVDYKLAKCCTPIPGDEVFGFVTVNEGIKIHRTNCPNSAELMANHGNRVVKAKWTSQHEVAFLTGLKIKGTDRVGLINGVTKVISEELKVNMSSMSIHTDTGIFEGEIMLYVNDTRHLEHLIAKLEQVEGVVKVSRFDSKETEPREL
ncbi:bifunctional (p)ppGpp synthetase/guanosine-3',5'-bis(diphosphate) 3'-pyrophosphohydrolase [Chryseotalea sanaruensis]|uniref:Bifunctional (P)ppGpp synthetase/guanosine-3',5'-bis(Diphosphate) 3'-pyrophosphohydrolase n=1 Tax=Chryseotalea sanaruensis TaxID=2482724 RepID=A0A401UDC8_9BACT|nr:RelA/SpoT family protein [Chryseotalea sanaruensis]GCC52883.1 bifunctional (p)ppGpp synthetase/guanosine-3',5'-bis(diphosphate) 3'-pyrophosphohydrolase [Chryseotalea sanaruensis]